MIKIASYLLISIWFYKHNTRMGSWQTGIIMAIFWPAVATMWCFGTYWEWEEEKEIKKLMEKYEK